MTAVGNRDVGRASARPIVITGARGYIGSALARRLASMGYRLRLVSREATDAGVTVTGRVETVRLAGSLADDGAWNGLIADAAAVIHLSAFTDLRAVEADPPRGAAINIAPLHRLIEAAKNRRDTPLVIVFASTVTIVGDRHDNPVDERTLDHPVTTYDSQKLAGERMLSDAVRRGIVRGCSLRLSNVYGAAGQSANSNRGILNAMIERAAVGNALTVFGDGSHVRDFIHLDDVVDAFHRAVDDSRAWDGGHFVIASGRGETLRQAFAIVAHHASVLTGRQIKVSEIAEPSGIHPIERRSFVGNAAAFRARTGWEPRVDLADGIRRSLEQIIGRNQGFCNVPTIK